jgi:DNA-binding transcriptional LysR family regulator
MTFENEITIGSEFGSFPDIQMDPLYRFKILPIMGPGHPFSSRQTVSFDEFSKKPLVLQEAGSGTRDKVIKLFEQYKCTPNLFLETSSYEMIKAVIQEGQCIGFLIEPAVSQEIKIGNILVVPLDAPDIYTTICIAYRKNSQLSLAAKTFLKEWKKTGQIMEYGEQP